MVKLITTGEYLPPLPEALPDEAFHEIGKLIYLTADRQEQLSEAAYLLIDGIYRHEARPNMRQVGARLRKIVRALRSRRLTDLAALLEIEALLKSDYTGDALSSLVTPHYNTIPHPRTLSAATLRMLRKVLAVSVPGLHVKLERKYGSKPGKETADYADLFIDRIGKIAEEAGIHPSAAYSDTRHYQKRCTRFVKLVIAVASAALKYLGRDTPEVRHARGQFTPGALEERAWIHLNPTARKRRAARALKYRRKKVPNSPLRTDQKSSGTFRPCSTRKRGHERQAETERKRRS